MTIKGGGGGFRLLMEKKNILNFHFDYLNTSLMPTPHGGMFGEESYP